MGSSGKSSSPLTPLAIGQDQAAPRQADGSLRASISATVNQRLAGPGGLYNIGNAIALAAGLTMNLVEVRGQDSFSSAVLAYFVGSPGATWLTVAILIFFVSGEAYHRAWQGSRPDLRLVRLGDLISAIGAAALTVSLAYFGDVLLAVVAGTLLFGGKLGNAVSPSGSWLFRLETRWLRGMTRTFQFDIFRMAVVVSRFPSLAALALEIIRNMVNGVSVSGLIMPIIMMICFAIWLRADILLTGTGETPSKEEASR